MIKSKDALNFFVGGIIGAIITGVLYTVSGLAEMKAYTEALARANERLETIAQKQIVAEKEAATISGHAEKIEEARLAIEKDQVRIQSIRESLMETHGEELARCLLADPSMREQLAVAVSKAVAPLKVAVEDCDVQFGLGSEGNLLLKARDADDTNKKIGFGEYRLRGTYPNVRAAWLAPYDDIYRFAKELNEYIIKQKKVPLRFPHWVH